MTMSFAFEKCSPSIYREFDEECIIQKYNFSLKRYKRLFLLKYILNKVGRGKYPDSEISVKTTFRFSNKRNQLSLDSPTFGLPSCSQFALKAAFDPNPNR